MVAGLHKLDALTRILEAEPFEAMLVFARTKQATVELVEKLEARGFAAAALNGDIDAAQLRYFGRVASERMGPEDAAIVVVDLVASDGAPGPT